MKTIKISEATDIQLDWLVAMWEGRTLVRDPMGFGIHTSEGGYWIWGEGTDAFGGTVAKSCYLKIGRDYSPSTNWSQSGPIIEQEKISINCPNDKGWFARDYLWKVHTSGFTPLIAAMRCLVVSKMSDIVEVPDELS